MERRPERDAGGKTLCPPLDRNDPQGEVERGPVQLLGELRDDDDPSGELLVGDLALDLHGGAAARSAPAKAVGGRVGGVQQADQPADVTGELDVAVDDL